MRGPLLTTTNSDIFPADWLLLVDAGASLGPAPTGVTGGALLQLTSSAVEGSWGVVRVGEGGTLTLGNRALVTATDSLLEGGTLLEVGGTLSSSSTSPLVSITGSRGGFAVNFDGDVAYIGGPTPDATLALTGGFLSLSGVPGGGFSIDGDLLRLTNVAHATLGGPLLAMTNSGTLANPITVPGALLRMELDSDFTFTGTGSVVTLSNSHLAVSGALLRLENGSSFTSTGTAPVIRIAGGSLTAGVLAEDDGLGNPITVSSTVLDMASGNPAVTLGAFANVMTAAQFNLPADTPVVNLQSGTLTLTTFDAPLVGYGAGSQSGIALRAAAGTTLTLQGPVVDLLGADLQDVNPIVQLNGGTICTPDCLGSIGERSIINVSNPSTARGPLFRMSAGTLRSGDALLGVNADLVVSGAGVGALLQFVGGLVDNVAEVAFAENGGILTLDRGLVDATSTTFTVGKDPGNVYSFVKVWNSSAIDATTADPLVRIQGGKITTVNPATSFFEIGDGGPMASLMLTGGGGLLKLQDVLAVGATTGISLGSGTLIRLNSGSLSTDGIALDMTNSTLGLPGPVLDAASSSVITFSGGAAKPAVRISGGALSASALAMGDGTNTFNIGATLLDLSGGATVTLGRTHSENGDTATITVDPGVALFRIGSGTLTLTEEGAPLLGYDEFAQSGIALAATAGATIDLKGPLVKLADTNLQETNPIIQLTSATVSHTGSGSSLIEVTSDEGASSAQGPLLRMVGGSLSSANSAVLGLVAADLAVSGAGTGALLQFENVSSTTGVSVGAEMAFVHPFGTLELDRGLVSAIDAKIVTGTNPGFMDPFIAIDQGATLLATTTDPLVLFKRTTGSVVGSLTTQAGEHFLKVGDGGPSLATLTLMGGGSLLTLENMPSGSVTIGSGTLIRLNRGELTLGGPGLEMINSTLTLSGPIVELLNGSTLTISGGPAIKLTNSALTADVIAFMDGIGTQTIDFGGTALDLTDSTLTLRDTGEVDDTNDANLFTGPVNTPLIRLTRSTLTVTGAEHDIIGIGDNAFPPTTGMLALVSTGTLANPSVINFTGTLVELEAFFSTATEPLIQLTRTTINQSGDGGLVFAEPNGGTISLSSPLMTVVDSTLNLTHGHLFELNNGLLAANDATRPFVQFDPVILNSRGDVFLIGGFGGPATLQLAHSLFKDTGGTLTVTNPNFNTVSATVATGASPIGVAVHPFQDRAYVTNSGAGTVTVVDTDALAPLTAVTVGSDPRAVAVRPGGSQAWVTNLGSGTVSLINTASHTLDGTITLPVSASPLGIAFNASGSLAYVADQAGSLHVINTGTFLIDATIPIPTGTPAHVVVAPNGTRAYVSDSSGRVSVINTLTNTVLTTVAVGGDPQGMAITRDGSRVYVANRSSGTVSVIDTATNVVTATVTVGTNPVGVALSGFDSRAYVTNQGGTVSVISTPSHQVIATITLGNTPAGIASDSGGSEMFVARTGSNTVSLLEADPGGTVLTVGGGSTMDATNGLVPVISLDGTALTTGTNGVLLQGGTLNVQGTLLQALGSTVSTGGSTLLVGAGGLLQDVALGPEPNALVTFSGGSLSTGFHVVNVSGNPSTGGGGTATMNLKRPIFSGTGTPVTATFNFMRLADDAQVWSAATTPSVQFAGGSFTSTGGTFLRMHSIAGQGPTSLTLDDGLLYASNASFTLPSGLFLDIRDSATLTSLGTSPFLAFVNSPASAGFTFMAFGPGGFSAGASGTQTPPMVSLNGALFYAADTGTALTFVSGTNVVALNSSFLSIFDGTTFTKTGGAPLVEVYGSAADRVRIDAESNVAFFGTTAAGKTPPMVTLSGRLIKAINARLESGDPASATAAFSGVFIGDGAVVAKTDSTPLLDFYGVNFVAGSNLLTLRRSQSSETNSQLVLGTGYLLDATNTTITTVNTSGIGTSSACCNGFTIGQGAFLETSMSNALIYLTNSTFDAGSSGVGGGNFFSVRDVGVFGADSYHLTQIPSLVMLDGGILDALNSNLSALFHGVLVERSGVTAGGPGSPVLAFNNTGNRTYSFGGNNPFGGVGLGSLLLATACVPASGGCTTTGTSANAADAVLTFNAQFLQSDNTGSGTRNTFNTTFDLVAIQRGAVLDSTTSLPFISSSNTTYNVGIMSGVTTQAFRHFFVLRDLGGASLTAPAAANFMGPLLSSTNDVFNVTAGFLEVNDAVTIGAFSASPVMLTRTVDTSPFMTFDDSTVRLGAVVGGVAGTGNFVEVNDNTGMSLNGPAALATFTSGVTPWTVDRLVYSECGVIAPCGPGAGNPGIDTGGSAAPFIAFDGPASGAHTVNFEMLKLLGFGTTSVVEEGNTLAVGTDQPLRHAGPLYQGSNSAAVTTGQVATVDRALLEASAPIIALLSGAALSSTSGDAFSLTNGGRIQGTLAASDALISLNMATMNVTGGSLFGLSGSSLLKVLGDLIRMSNSSTLSITSVSNGFLLNLSGNSVATISGALFNFQGAGNTVNIGNNSAPTTTIAGIPVLLTNGALASQVTITNPIKNSGNGTINYTNGGSLIKVDGTSAKVRVDGL
jgi:YVTN family beta-propeller protein